MSDCRILIVDDFEDFRRFISAALQKDAKFKIVGEASDGLEALAKAKELQPDLILLDIGLPKLNGLEVAKRVRPLTPAKILFLTALFDPDLAQQALSLGQGYVHKARAQNDLLSAIDAVLRGEQFVSPGLEISGGSGAPSHRHEVVFCSRDGVLLDTLAQFIATALKAGDAVIALVKQLHRESLLQKLNAMGVDVDVAIERGNLIPWDVREALSTFIVNDWPDEVRLSRALSDLIKRAVANAAGERRRVVTCGECAPTLWEEGNVDAAIRVEHLWNESTIKYGVDTLCVYPSLLRPEDDYSFKRLCAEHSAISYR